MRNLIQELIYKNCKRADDTKMAYYWETQDNQYMVALSGKHKYEYYILKFRDRKKKAECENCFRDVYDFNIMIGDFTIMLEPTSENASIIINCGTDKQMAAELVSDLRQQHIEQKRERYRREKYFNKCNQKTK